MYRFLPILGVTVISNHQLPLSLKETDIFEKNFRQIKYTLKKQINNILT
jgi:hypothetical protein